jgi:CDP-diacylglycerol--glycerol-3-phosphate 3-phosphatidyltransferase
LNQQNNQVLGKLRWQWGVIALVWVGVVMAFWWWDWLPRNGRSLLFALLTATCCLWILWRGLPQNHRATEKVLLPTLGLGNHLTLLRGLAISLVAGYILVPRPDGGLAWLPMLLYTFADFADYFDGYLARKTNHATPLGSTLDIEYDGMGMLVVSVLGVWWGMLPWWYLLLGVARHWFVLGMWWRQQRGKPNHDMVASVHRRLFAGFQMGFMSAVLWPIIPPDMTRIAGTIFGLATGTGFLRDWWTVNGHLAGPRRRLHRQSVVFHRFWHGLYRLSKHYLPPLLRLLLPLCMAMIYGSVSNWWSPTAWADLMTSWGMAGTAVYATLLTLIALIGTILVTLGVMGRLWSSLLVFPIGFNMATADLTLWNGLATTAVITLALLGTGPFSLWQPEEQFVMHRAGEGG